MEDTLCEDGRKTSLRDRIKKSMGTGIQVLWSSMPEVQSSGLLENLSDNQLALEELKFCLITCEVAFNIELVELVNLCKRSVSWADPLPVFNRRTIASSVDRIKRCSDGFLNLIEKHWNMKPTLSVATFCKILTDMALQLQNFVTFCTQQEDLRSVLNNAMRSKPEIAVTSVSNRMNIELLLLPLQHLTLFCYLLQDIRSELISMTNRLESFHCKRALTDVTNLLEECYKALASLHGSKYVENLEKLLEESVHSCDQDYYKKFCYEISQQHMNYATGRRIFRRSSSNSSVHVKWKKSYQSSKTSEIENKNKIQSVKEHCKFFSFYFLDSNNNNQKSLSSNRSYSSKSEKSKLKRQKPIDAHKRSNFHITEKGRSSPAINNRLSKFEVQEKNNNNLYKGNNFSAKSKFILGFPDKVQVNRSEESNCEKYDILHEHIYSTLEDENSNKDSFCVNNEIELSSKEKLEHFTEMSSLISCKNDLPNNVDIKSSCFGDESKLNEDNTKLPSSKPNHPIDFSVKLVENESTGTSIRASVEGQTSVIVSERNYLSNCDTSKPTILEKEDNLSSQTPPLEVKFTFVETTSVEDRLTTNIGPSNASRLQRESYFPSSVKKHEPPCHKSVDESDVHSLYEEISVKSSHGMSEKLNSTTDFADSLNKIKETFISSYDFGHTEVQKNDITETKNGNVDYENDEDDNKNYQPMHESLTRKHNSISPSKFKKKISSESACETRRNGIDLKKFPIAILSVPNSDCVHEYEELEECNSKRRSESILSRCEDVPLYQAFRFRNVKVRKSVGEENLYVEPDEHVYEDIEDYLNTQTKTNSEEIISVPNMEISKPSGSSERVRWVDIMEVINSGLLDGLDNTQLALQEAKYEVITSEASYFKSLIILEAIFISNLDLKNILTEPEYDTLFSSVMKVKQCSQTFLVTLLEGWQDDLMLNYLCKSISKFVESGAFHVYVDCCANQMNVNRTLECLRLNNPVFIEMLSKLESDPVCQSFTLQSFLTLPMQRVTRLPLLVEAILRRLPANVPESHSWKNLLSQLQEVANECNEAIGKADRKTVIEYEQMRLMNEKILTLNGKQSYQKKKPQTIWNIFKIKR